MQTKQKLNDTSGQQTLCGVEDAEKVEDGVVDVSRAQEGQTPGGPHQAGQTQHCEAAPAGCTQAIQVPLRSEPRFGPERVLRPTDAQGHCQQYARVEDEDESEVHQVRGVEEGVICDPAAAGQAGHFTYKRLKNCFKTYENDNVLIDCV